MRVFGITIYESNRFEYRIEAYTWEEAHAKALEQFEAQRPEEPDEVEVWAEGEGEA